MFTPLLKQRRIKWDSTFELYYFLFELCKEGIHKSTSTFTGYSFFESSDDKIIDTVFFEETGSFVDGATLGTLKNEMINEHYYLEQGKMVLELEK